MCTKEQFIKINGGIYNVRKIISILPGENPTTLEIETDDGSEYVDFDSENERDSALTQIAIKLDAYIII